MGKEVKGGGDQSPWALRPFSKEPTTGHMARPQAGSWYAAPAPQPPICCPSPAQPSPCPLLTLVAVTDGAEVHIVLVIGKEQEAEPGVEGVDRHDEEDAHDVALLVGAAVAAQVHVDLEIRETGRRQSAFCSPPSRALFGLCPYSYGLMQVTLSPTSKSSLQRAW